MIKRKHLLLTLSIMIILVLFLTTACSSSNDKSDDVSMPEGEEVQQSEDIKWPTQPIEIVVPYSAGGDTDFNARALAKYLTEEIDESVVVVNISGGGGTIGMDEVINANPDGYRLVVNHCAMHMAEAFGVSNYGWDAFEPIATYGQGTGELLVVRSDFPADTVSELIEETKRNPGKYKFGVNPGATSHYAAAKLTFEGADMNIVASGSASERVVALKGNHLDIIVAAMPVIKDYVTTGEFKVIAAFTSERYPTYDSIPTMKEQGYDISFDHFYTLYAPKGTDPRIIEKLEKAIEKVVTTNEVYADDIRKAYNQVPFFMGKEETVKFLTEQQESYMKDSEMLRSFEF